jgi:hypothetical protein
MPKDTFSTPDPTPSIPDPTPSTPDPAASSDEKEYTVKKGCTLEHGGVEYKEGDKVKLPSVYYELQKENLE